MLELGNTEPKIVMVVDYIAILLGTMTLQGPWEGQSIFGTL